MIGGRLLSAYDRTADLLNAMAEMLWEIREYTENMEDMERYSPSIFQIAP